MRKKLQLSTKPPPPPIDLEKIIVRNLRKIAAISENGTDLELTRQRRFAEFHAI